MNECKILKANSLEKLEKIINEYITNGYQVSGGITVESEIIDEVTLFQYIVLMVK
ncbi:hypothetical protein R4J03_13280 [Brachyspira intermedia]|uniref:hypothetical protein n=1 Tax=Brachyspira intermedia TaxID=84377 RepID=UPI002636E580|nr:hypothetical protein [uncultured Brachyspira sp.]